MNPPCRSPLDASKYRENYVANLKLQADNNQKNLNANMILKSTGQSPNQPTDNRTTTERVADQEGLKQEVRSFLQEQSFCNSTVANEVAQRLTPDQRLFVIQYKLFIATDFKGRNVPTAVMGRYIAALQDKIRRTNGVDFGLQQATGEGILASTQQILNIMVRRQDIAALYNLLQQIQAEIQAAGGVGVIPNYPPPPPPQGGAPGGVNFNPVGGNGGPQIALVPGGATPAQLQNATGGIMNAIGGLRANLARIESIIPSADDLAALRNAPKPKQASMFERGSAFLSSIFSRKQAENTLAEIQLNHSNGDLPGTERAIRRAIEVTAMGPQQLEAQQNYQEAINAGVEEKEDIGQQLDMNEFRQQQQQPPQGGSSMYAGLHPGGQPTTNFRGEPVDEYGFTEEEKRRNPQGYENVVTYRRMFGPGGTHTASASAAEPPRKMTPQEAAQHREEEGSQGSLKGSVKEITRASSQDEILTATKSALQTYYKSVAKQEMAALGMEKPAVSNLNKEQLQSILIGLLKAREAEHRRMNEPQPLKESGSTASMSRSPETTRESDYSSMSSNGQGLKPRLKGRGLGKSHISRGHVDGEFVKPKPYKPFGKYLINHHKLGDGILMVHRPSGVPIKDLPTQKVSPNVVYFLKSLLGGITPHEDVIRGMGLKEKEHLHHIVRTCRIENCPDLAPNKDADSKENDRFDILKGEIIAGNDNKALIKEFKLMLMKMLQAGRIPRREAHEILVDLASMGF